MGVHCSAANLKTPGITVDHLSKEIDLQAYSEAISAGVFIDIPNFFTTSKNK